jgi:hypothetical protein
MNFVTVLAVIGGTAGLAGGTASIANALYLRKQTRLLQDQINSLRSKDASYAEWTLRWEKAVEALGKIYPGVIPTTIGTSSSALGIALSQQLRQRIGHHLGKRVFFTQKFQPRQLSRDELLNPAIQDLIRDVLEAVEKFKREHPDWARGLKLLPPT